MSFASIIFQFTHDILSYIWSLFRSREATTAENLFPSRQRALYKERNIKPQATDLATRITLTWLSGQFDWRDALMTVRASAFTRRLQIGSLMRSASIFRITIFGLLTSLLPAQPIASAMS